MAGFSVLKTVFILPILATYLLYLACPAEALDPFDSEILILGAGTAGLQAARILQAANITNYRILEGSDQIGGLVQSVNFGGLDIPSGIDYLYVKPEDEETLAGLESLGFEIRPASYDSYVVLNDQGEDVTEEADERYAELLEAVEKSESIIAQIVEGQRSDLPARTSLAMSGWVANSPTSHVMEWWDFDLAEGVQSKHISTIGLHIQDLGDGYSITNINKGLYPDVEVRLNEGNLKLNSIVRNIDQTGEKVVVTLEDGKEYTANYVLLTFSVGVLQQGGVTFNPPLPDWKNEQIFNYQRGTIEQIFLKFSSKFWGDEEWILHASDRPQDVDRQYYPIFRNWEVEGLYPAGSNILSAIFTGEEALRVEGLMDEEIREEVLDVLRSMFGEDNVSELEDMFFRRWASDPFHYGTFTTWPIPAYWPPDVNERLAAKVDRVYFAQQASSYDIGIQRGSIDASERAMKGMLGCIDTGECADYIPVNPLAGGNSGNGGNDDDELYGCVKVLKKEGKTRKQVRADEE